ncbi:DNA polymerase Y family protein [Actinomycetaceae bacterium L2_0104]
MSYREEIDVSHGGVWIPNWPVTAAELAGEVPVGVPAAVCGNRGVLAVNAWASREGIEVGMGKRLAHSLCPDTVLLAPDAERDVRRFEPVLRALDHHIARITVLEPGSVLFSARGALRSTGSPEALADAIVGEIAEIAGCEAQVGFANGTLATLLATRENSLVRSQGSSAYLHGQRTSVLLLAVTTPRMRVELTDCIELLDRLGVRTLGGIHRMGRSALATRFGSTGLFIWQLVSGEDVRMPDPKRSTPDFGFARAFEPPLENAQQAAFAARQLATDLAEEMAARSLGGGRLTITANLVNGNELQRAWVLDGGGVKDVVDRVRWQLGSWVDSAEEGAAVARLELAMTDLLPAGRRQQPLWGGKGVHEEQSGRSAVRLQSLLGEESVRVPQKIGGRVPSERFGDRAWNEAKGSSAAAELPWPGSIPDPAPSIVHPTPLPVEVYADCGHPLRVSGEGVLACAGGCEDPEPAVVQETNCTFPVTDFSGPWVMEQRWWADCQRRAYLQVVGSDSALLVYIEGGQWQEEGRYA